MRLTKLNLSALRNLHLPLVKRTRINPEQLTNPSNASSLSRRQFLGLASAAMVGIPPTLKAIGTVMLGDFEFVSEQKRIAFKLGGTERWVIDTNRFSGAPKLKVNRSANLIRFELINAFYPGTNLPADLDCELHKSSNGWRMKLKMSFGRFECEVPFEKWLIGSEKARSVIDIDALVCELGASSKITLSGTAEAEFFPDWTILLRGSNIAEISGHGKEIVSNRFSVSLLKPDEPSIMEEPEQKRTLIVMERGGQAWRLEISSSLLGDSKFEACEDLFDTLQVELGESDEGFRRCALVAESRNEKATLFFQPNSSFTDLDGNPFKLPLSNVRYAVAFDQSGEQTALIAKFSEKPVWLHAGEYCFELGGISETPQFELVCSDGEVELRCEPSLLRMAVPLPDAVVEPTPVPEGTHIAFVQSTISQPRPPLKLPKPEPRKPEPEKEETRVPKPKPEIVIKLSQPLVVDVVRPEDLLVLRFEFVNLSVQGGNLVRINANQPAFIIAHFPPQSIAEQVFWESAPGFGGTEETPTTPVQSRISGLSRLVFAVPDGVKQIPYTLKDLLKACTQFPLSIAPNAELPPAPLMPTRFRPIGQSPAERPGISVTPTQPTIEERLTRAIEISEPLNTQTAIELPYRLILSPNRYAAWIHAFEAVTKGGWTELWHTRLAVRLQDGSIQDGRYIYRWDKDVLRVRQVLQDEDTSSFGIHYRTVRAIWTQGYKKPPTPLPAHSDSPFKMSLDERNRHEIVRLTADPSLSDWTKRVIRVKHLMLTSLGAWMSVRYAESPPKGYALEEWRHEMTMGRDHFVCVVEKGYLFPFGHRASLVTITERKFHSKLPGNPAYLRKRMFLIVREPEKVYGNSGLRTEDGKSYDLYNPFRSIRITTLSTPNLDDPQSGVNNLRKDAFWLRVGGKDFLFHIIAEDSEGKRCEFTAPLIFVNANIADNETTMKQIASHYDKEKSQAQRDFHGQKVAFAESRNAGDTTFEVESITFSAVVPDQKVKLPSDQPRFYPIVSQASIRLSAIQQLLGKDMPAIVRFSDTYLKSGFEGKANKGEVFLEVLNKPQIDFRGSGDKAGGVVTPNFAISGLSRLAGPFGGKLETAEKGEVDYEEVFEEALEACLLGGIRLIDVLSRFASFDEGLKVTTYTLNPVTQKPLKPNEAYIYKRETCVSLTWETEKLRTVSIGGFFEFACGEGKPSQKGKPGTGNEKTKLFIEARLVAKQQVPGKLAEPDYYVEGVINNFKIRFVKFICVQFEHFKFRVGKGKKFDVDPKVKDVKFEGHLDFVNKLSKLIPSGGFSDPPYLKPTMSPIGIKAGYSIGLPPVACGVFSLREITLGAELRVPFTGDPVELSFDFCKPEKPFVLTVWIFGGGGSLNIGLKAKDPVEVILGASFEFGAMFALDIGVASGEAHLAAGLFYHYEGGSVLMGYLRCGGALEILGIVTISVEFRMELTYDDTTSPTRVWGRATVKVTIEIVFFSVSYDLTMEREFAGSSRHLPFTEMVTTEQWREYCEAFA